MSSETSRIESSDLNQLRLILVEHFNLSEIRNLCFALNVDYEQLAGEEKASKARELVDYMSRHGRVQDLVIAIQAERPDADLRLPTPAEQPNPYRGLFAFREEDAANFFGREPYTDKLVKAVESQSFIAFVGPSGSGKSSVVFAGLLPSLRPDPQWQIVDFRPGDRPFYNLAAALVSLDETLTSRTERLDETQRLTEALSREENPLPLTDVIGDLLQEKEEGSRLLLVADQFEELYTLVPDPVQRDRFLDLMLSLDGVDSTVLLLTLRADFLGQALRYRPFADALQDHDIKLGPMTNDELRTAIRYPAQNAGVTFEQGLEDRIVRNLADEPGNLPLLQFALTEMWDRQVQGQLTHAAYEEIGRVDGALAHYADQVYGDLDEAEKQDTRDVFMQLVHPGSGTEYTRRLALRTEMSGDDWQMAQKLASARLVVTGQDNDGRDTVEVVHESLIRDWNKLRDWLEADRAYLIWLSQLRIKLEQWHESGKNEGALLRGIDLDGARVWLAERGDDLSPDERAFIKVSADQQRREKLFIRALLATIPFVVILAVVSLWLGRDYLLINCVPNCENVGWLLSGIDWSREEVLANANLKGANLSNANLSLANLSKATLTEVDLTNANLSGANLDGAVFKEYGSEGQALLKDAIVIGAGLRKANLSEVNLREAVLRGADLSEADLVMADLFNADLSGADLSGANLHGSDLSEADLSGANLFAAFLSKANLSGANLSGANLIGAKLIGAKLRWADLSEADLSGAFLIGAILFGADLSEADLSRINLRGADLSGAKLRRADLSEARYDANTQWPHGFDFANSGAIGPEANLSGANLIGANLSGADLSGANLSDAGLSGADLSGANLIGANLSGANLSEADLERAWYDANTQWPDDFNFAISGAIGPGAYLSGADLSGANLSGANLSGAGLSAARYDEYTQWPDGFDPVAAGAILVEEE